MNRNAVLCEAEVTPGLEFVTEGELETLGAATVNIRPGEIDFRFSGDLQAVARLRTVQAVSIVQHYPVPRPRALLSNEYFPLLLRQIETVRALSDRKAFKTLLIAAAGADSTVMMRIRDQLVEKTGLKAEADKADLWIRIRPGRAGQGGWETLVRLTPRPSVTRSWRVCQMEGALNAATAHAMILLTRPKPNDTYVNLACGSGTLLIERMSMPAPRHAIGIDISAENLSCARVNVDASGYDGRIRLWQADATHIPLASQSVDALCADLPFGQLTGSHAENQRLYPALLADAGRVARPGARFVLITHEIRLMERLLGQDQPWTLEQSIRVNLRGLHPRIYVLKRR